MAYKIVTAMVAMLMLAACDRHGSDIEIHDPWVRATPPGQVNAAVYFTVVNNMSASDWLIGVETPGAADAGLHVTTVADGVVRMNHHQRMEMAAAGRTIFEPGARHVMLMGLREPLIAGARFAMTLTFENYGPIEIMVEVRPVRGAEAAP